MYQTDVQNCDLRTLRFLAFVDLLGTPYKATTIATGYGAYTMQTLLQKLLTEDQT